MATSTVEDYLKCIFLEQERLPGSPVSTGQIAAGLDVAPGTVTSMLKTLADSGLVDYAPYAGVRLTDAGNQLAMRVLRRHRLVEAFLVRFMGFDWSEVHGDAELLEHAISDRVLERIDEMLGHPAIDPHGDPIPNADGEIARREHDHLLDCPLDRPSRVARVVDQRADFLRLLDRHGVIPGRRVRVIARDDLAETLELRSEDRPPLRLGFRAASMILVDEQIENDVAAVEANRAVDRGPRP